MLVVAENYGEMFCDIVVKEAENQHIETLKFKVFDDGLISGSSLGSVRVQFQTFCNIVDTAGMVVTL